MPIRPAGAPSGLAPRSQRASFTEMTEYVLPQHAGRPCVTAFVDDLMFKRPVRVGQVVRLRAQVTATFRTSMEIEVSVWLLLESDEQRAAHGAAEERRRARLAKR